MKRLIGLFVLFGLALAAPLFAAVPSTMSYQGVLTDNAGNLAADGNYSFVFKVYTVPVAGVAIWTETQNPVAVAKGGFNVVLGSVTPLDLAFDVQYYLGIAVNGGAEISPRVTLGAAPYSMSLRLPFSGSTSSNSPALSIANGGTGADIAADHLLTIGSPTASGALTVWQNGAALPTAQLYDFSGRGAALDFYDEAGGYTTRLEPDGSGAGGWFSVLGGTGGGAFTVDGMSTGGSPLVTISGPGSATTFVTSATGDGAVVLPASSVSASEVLDEPGVAQGHVVGTVNLNATMTDIVSVTITTPAPGYIILEADGQHNAAGNALNYNYAELQITETSLGAQDFAHYFYSGCGTTAPNGSNYAPVSIRRTYFKAAGSYTFYFQGYKIQGAVLANYVYNSTITATYVPTSYGTVTELANASDASQYSRVTPVAAAANGGDAVASAGAFVQVDLRELELKAARAKADAERAERQLIEARLAQQRPQAAALRGGVKK